MGYKQFLGHFPLTGGTDTGHFDDVYIGIQAEYLGDAVNEDRIWCFNGEWVFTSLFSVFVFYRYRESVCFRRKRSNFTVSGSMIDGYEMVAGSASMVGPAAGSR